MRSSIQSTMGCGSFSSSSMSFLWRFVVFVERVGEVALVELLLIGVSRGPGCHQAPPLRTTSLPPSTMAESFSSGRGGGPPTFLPVAGIVRTAVARAANDVRRGVERHRAPEMRAGGDEGRELAVLAFDHERRLGAKSEVLAGPRLEIIWIAERNLAHLDAFVDDLRAGSEVAHDGVGDGDAVTAGCGTDHGLTRRAAGEHVLDAINRHETPPLRASPR